VQIRKDLRGLVWRQERKAQGIAMEYIQSFPAGTQLIGGKQTGGAGRKRGGWDLLDSSGGEGALI